MPNYGLGRRWAGRTGLLSGRSWAERQQEAGPGPSNSEASGRPSWVLPDPLLTVGAFESIFRPLEIGRHLGGRLSSPGVSELLSGLGRRGDEGEPARGSTRLDSSRPRPAGQRRKGGNHVILARRRRCRHPGPGCRGGPPRAHRPPHARRRAGIARASADVAAAASSACLGVPLGQQGETLGRRLLDPSLLKRGLGWER